MACHSYSGKEDEPTVLPHNCDPCDEDGWTRTSAADEGRWFYSTYLQDSDDLVNKSNQRVFREMFADSEGSWWKDSRHGFIVRTLAYRNIDRVCELIDNLDDSCIIDEDDYSHLEMETEQECWEDYGRDDIRRDLRAYIAKRFAERGIDADKQGRDPDAIVEALSDGQIDAWYGHTVQAMNCYGGGWCQIEGDGAVFADETVWGRSGSSWKGIDRDAWDGLMPTADEDGKVDYHTGEIVGWFAAVDIDPWCPRCHRVSNRFDTDTECASPWEAPCEDLGCDVPTVATLTPMGEQAAYVLRSWGAPNAGQSVGDALDRLSKLCDAVGDKRSAVTLHHRDPDNASYGTMLQHKGRDMVRACLRGLVTGELPKPSQVKPEYENAKPVCCIISERYCCEHGKGAKETCMLLSSDSKAECPIHGTRENRHKRGEVQS